MSGILDKKSRFVDYVLTENGRRQIQNNDIRFRYATFSDKSIVYQEKDKVSLDDKLNISDEMFYLPFEQNTNVNDDLNPEFSLKNFISYDNDDSSSLTLNDLNFDSKVNEIENNLSIGANLRNLKYLETISPRDIESIKFIDQESVENNNKFRLLNANRIYDTLIQKDSVIVSNLPSITLDKRFSQKNNFKRLIPTSDGVELYDEKETSAFYQRGSDINYVLSNYNEDAKVNENDSINDAVLKTIKHMMENKSIEKKVYEVSNYSSDDLYILDFHEFNYDSENSAMKNSKLSFIDIGTFYNKKGQEKNVYLIGKVINSRNNNNKDDDIVFSFNKGVIQEKSPNKAFVLSNYYSFLCMFTLVVE